MSSLLTRWNNFDAPLRTALSDIAQQASDVITATSNTLTNTTTNILNGVDVLNTNNNTSNAKPTPTSTTPKTQAQPKTTVAAANAKKATTATAATASTKGKAATGRTLPTTRDKSEVFRTKRSEVLTLEIAKQNSVLKKLYDERKREVERTKSSVKAVGMSSAFLKMVSIARSAAACSSCLSMVKLYENCVACNRKFCPSCYEIYHVEVPIDLGTDSVKELVKFLLCKDCGSCVKSLQKKQEWLEAISTPAPMLYIKAEGLASKRDAVAQLLAKYEYFITGILSPDANSADGPTRSNDDTKIEESIHEQIVEYENKLMIDITHLREALDLFRSIWAETPSDEDVQKSIIEMTEDAIDSMIASFHNLQTSKSMNDIIQLQRMYIQLLQLITENSANEWYKRQFAAKYSTVSEVFLKELNKWMKEEMVEGDKRFQEFTVGLSRLKREPNSSETLLSGPASELVEPALLRENIRLLKTRFVRVVKVQIGPQKGSFLLSRLEQLLEDVESSYQI